MWIYDKKEKVENQVKTYLDMSKFPTIKGYDFDNKFNFQDFMNSYLNMGFQGSNLGVANNILHEIIRKKEEAKKNNTDFKIFLAFTGNMISSGNREIIKFLVKNGYIDGITTSSAGIE